MNLKIVILAGGTGTRLWPMSTAQKPKQFQKLVSEKTMLRETFERVKFVGTDNIFVSTNMEYTDLVRQDLPEIPNHHLILEPCMRDTAPCIGLAAAKIAQEDPNAVMAIVYADHLVQDHQEFEQKLCAAARLAEEENTLNIIEVKAKTPSTSLGYVRIGQMLKTIEDVEVYEFKAFKEKPDYETAKKFLSSYSYLWNTGYYVWKTERILEEFKKHLPETFAQLHAIQKGGDINQYYPLCDKISIDYGIMEKVDPKNVRIIPADLGWSDIGTFASLHEEVAENPWANVIKGDISAVDVQGCLLYNQGPDHFAIMGVKDLVVVHADGNTLICPKERSSDLKTLLAEVKKHHD